MSRRPAALLVLLTLLAFAGQLVAAPFLVCPMANHRVQPQVTELEHTQHHGHMASHHDHGKMEKSEASHSMSKGGHHDCDGWCAQCSGNCTHVVPQQEFLSIAPDSSYLLPQQTILPYSRLNDLFKPPIPA